MSSLQNTLQTLVESGTTSNLALNNLISDYSKYHMVLLVVGGLFLLGLMLSSVLFWTQFKNMPSIKNQQWSFEKKTYFYFAVISILVGLLMALIVAANLSSVLSARQGFSESIVMLKTPRTGTPRDQLYQSFNAWLQSGRGDMPVLIQNKIADRLSWQQPKAIVSGFLLVLLISLSVQCWCSLIQKSRVQRKWNLKEPMLFLAGAVTTIV